MLQPGAIVDNKYCIEAVIGRGGFGYVYRAREQLTGELVAIKELVPGMVNDPGMVQRFIQEARATLRLTHPNIARTFGIFQAGGTYYLAMEYLAGGSLADRLERGPLPVDEAVRIAAELCLALECAHKQGVIHCDIKPANVLFDARGAVRLADFGIAHVSEQLLTRGLVTVTGLVMGTVQYMAPEQLEGVRNDPRLDIYALGALLYEMLAGRVYLDFETETTPAAQARNLQRIQKEPPRPPRLANPAAPEWLAQVVDRSLRKAPQGRFPTAAAFRQALLRAAPQTAPVAGPWGQPAQAGGGGGPAPYGGLPAQPYRAPVQPAPPAQAAARRGPTGWQWGTAGGVGLVVVIALVALLSGGRGGRPAPFPTGVTRLPVETSPAPSAIPPVPSAIPVEPTTAPSLPKPLPTAGLPDTPVPPTDTALPLPPAPTARPVSTPLGGGSGRIAFSYVARDTNGSGGLDWNDAAEIWTINSDGSGEQQLTNDGAFAWDPAWSPDGSRIAYDSDVDGDKEIYVMSRDGSGRQQLTSNHGYDDAGPWWSPDGSQIAFHSNRDGNREIYVMWADGSGQTRLTYDASNESYPVWSPDGSKIAFDSDLGGDKEIWVMERDGSNRVQLTENGDLDYWPRWSPDGSQLVYMSGSTSRARICVVNIYSRESRCLTSTGENAASPAWSPDGQWIAFSFWDTAKKCTIYLMDANGQNRRRLTQHSGLESRPAWAP